jgi:membrane-bound lytic murein transglycosylase A
MTGCSTTHTTETPKQLRWKLVAPSKIELQEPLNYQGIKAALTSSVEFLKRKPAQERLAVIKEAEIITNDLLNALEDLSLFVSTSQPRTSDIRKYLKENFCAYEAEHPKLFTGYYRATLNGSLTRTHKYKFPVYAEPSDLITLRTADFAVLKQVVGIPSQVRGRLKNKQLVPYLSRAEINSGHESLNQKARILAWVDDPIELFFMHIQGSGKIILPNKKYLELGYSNSNGWPYRAIGAYLISNGHIKPENMSKHAIVDFLRNNQELVPEILNYNPSFVFFQPKPEGTYGALNQPLVAGHSLASDHSVYPAAAPLIINIKSSVTVPEIKRLTFNQDVGGAIKGPGRFDLFCGEGPEAEQLAGYLKNRGQVTLLVPRSSFKEPCPK